VQDVFAEIRGPENTPFENGVFKMKLVLPSERVLFDENFPPEHPTTVRGDLREHVETGLEARFRFATRVDGHSVLVD
jgi:hypothetical protein